MIDMGALLRGVTQVVEAEGRLLLAEFNAPTGPRGSHASAPIDVEIEARLKVELARLLPCDFVGEETDAVAGSVPGWCWLVDPHDGTREYLAARRGSAISVGLVRDGVPVLGVVFSPNAPDLGSDLVAWAEDCGPVTRNGMEVRERLEGRSLSQRELAWATASSALRPATYLRAVSPARYVAMPSIAYRLARVAAGDGVAATSIHSISEYDVAAGAALLRGAGGVLLDAEGREPRFTGRPGARFTGCFAGARDAALALSRFDWSALERETRLPRRVETAFPLVAEDARLARAQGCLLGLVIGDSLGSLVAHRDAAEVAERFPHGVRELADGGTWGTQAGQPSGSAELALALARSLLAEHGYEAHVARLAYQHWLASHPFDLAPAMQRALTGTVDATVEDAGALVRIASLGIWSAGHPGRAADAARQDARLTHPGDLCVASCGVLAATLAEVVGGAALPAIAAVALDAAKQGPAAVRDAIDLGLAGQRPDVNAARASVLVTLQEAFYQLAHADGFEEGVVASVSGGGDSHWRGAITGALLGAREGSRRLPSRWVLPVLACRASSDGDAFRPRPRDYWPDDVLDIAEALLKLASP